MCQPYIESTTVLSDYEYMQETTVFHGRQKLTSAMKQKPEKWW